MTMYQRAKRIGFGVGVAAVVAIGFLATSGQYVQGPLGSIAGALNVTGEQSDTSTGTQNDFALTSTIAVLRWNGASAVTFTGFATPSAGRFVYIDNVTAAQSMTFTNATGSTASQQLNTPVAASLVCPAKTRAVIRYDSTLTKWVVAGGSGCYSQATSTLSGAAVQPPWTSSRYYLWPGTGAVTATATSGIGSLRCLARYIPNAVTITRIGAEVTSAGDAGSKVRLCIYGDDGTGQPGSLVVDAGQIAGDSATVQEITGLSTAVGPGTYWGCSVVQSVSVTQPTLRTANNFDGGVVSSSTIPGAAGVFVGYISTGSVAGACPGTYTGTSSGSFPARIFTKT